MLHATKYHTQFLTSSNLFSYYCCVGETSEFCFSAFFLRIFFLDYPVLRNTIFLLRIFFLAFLVATLEWIGTQTQPTEVF